VQLKGDEKLKIPISKVPFFERFWSSRFALFSSKQKNGQQKKDHALFHRG
jgi:hypothetical protein